MIPTKELTNITKVQQVLITGCLWIIISALPTAQAASVVDYLDDLFQEFKAEYSLVMNDEYVEFCDYYKLNSGMQENRNLFLKINFFHELLTTVSASNCARGGFLRIPYFWHWVNPNPRHSIFSLPDSIPLSRKSPPSGFKRYKSFADIDRVPSLFLGDLVSEDPGYFHPDCGKFYSFGWCSEREMAFTSLMTAMGERCKIIQSGIHTKTVILCCFYLEIGEPEYIEAIVDNTFESLLWRAAGKEAPDDCWENEIGEGTDINFYNERAKSTEQINNLQGINVGLKSRERIREAVKDALADF